jgi:membrane protein implicated in regulation of membrane protease activity
MVTLAKWKLDKTMVIWGVAFGIAATLSGMFVLSALEGGFVAEGFFLLVISWIFYIVLVARILRRLKEGRKKDDF